MPEVLRRSEQELDAETEKKLNKFADRVIELWNLYENDSLAIDVVLRENRMETIKSRETFKAEMLERIAKIRAAKSPKLTVVKLPPLKESMSPATWEAMLEDAARNQAKHPDKAYKVDDDTP